MSAKAEAEAVEEEGEAEARARETRQAPAVEARAWAVAEAEMAATIAKMAAEESEARSVALCVEVDILPQLLHVSPAESLRIKQHR